MMSVGLHVRMIDYPFCTAGMARLLDHLQKHDDVWVTRRIDIARHWTREHPYPGKGLSE
jgi:allantoinase